VLTRLAHPRAFVVMRGLVALAAIGYVLARAIYVPLTYDEVVSFRNYVSRQPVDLFEFSVATNHFANSVLTRISSVLFGDSAWALRLPNVLAAIGYVWCAVVFCARIERRLIGLAGLVLLVTNPYVLEYLALSRGYGLALSSTFCAVCLLISWWDRPSATPSARRRLGLSTALAGLAVVANFGVLSAFVALVVLAGVRLAIAMRRSSDTVVGENASSMRLSSGVVTAWVIVALAFSGLVFARARVLSDAVFTPITVRIAGLFEDELAVITVLSADATGRLRPLRKNGWTWTSGPVRDAQTLRVSLPAVADRNLAGLDVTAGTRSYHRDRRDPGPWRTEDFRGRRLLIFDDILEWQGDATHLRIAMTFAAVTVGMLMVLGGGMVVISRIMARLRLTRLEDARILAYAALGVATVMAAPIYLLHRDGQLFFGGTTGIIVDAFGSLVVGSLYGAEYGRLQVSAGLGALGLMAVGSLASLLLSRRRGQRAVSGALLVVTALIAVIAAEFTLLHWLTATPYPTGRTAIFLLPLLLLLPTLLAEAVSAFGRRSARLATALLLLAALASSWHWAQVANVTRTLDWARDQSTPAMLRFVAQTDTFSPVVPGTVRIGVDWMFYPVVQYYAEQQSTSGIRYEAIVLPGDGFPVDVTYTRSQSEFGDGTVIRRYAESDAVLRVRSRRQGQ
jgi:hypothetical protein